MGREFLICIYRTTGVSESARPLISPKLVWCLRPKPLAYTDVRYACKVFGVDTFFWTTPEHLFRFIRPDLSTAMVLRNRSINFLILVM
jgi:hypothetical protein